MARLGVLLLFHIDIQRQRWLANTAAIVFLVFPFTLAYVVIVQRPMTFAPCCEWARNTLWHGRLAWVQASPMASSFTADISIRRGASSLTRGELNSSLTLGNCYKGQLGCR